MELCSIHAVGHGSADRLRSLSTSSDNTNNRRNATGDENTGVEETSNRNMSTGASTWATSSSSRLYTVLGGVGSARQEMNAVYSNESQDYARADEDDRENLCSDEYETQPEPQFNAARSTRQNNWPSHRARMPTEDHDSHGRQLAIDGSTTTNSSTSGCPTSQDEDNVARADACCRAPARLRGGDGLSAALLRMCDSSAQRDRGSSIGSPRGSERGSRRHRQRNSPSSGSEVPPRREDMSLSQAVLDAEVPSMLWWLAGGPRGSGPRTVGDLRQIQHESNRISLPITPNPRRRRRRSRYEFGNPRVPTPPEDTENSPRPSRSVSRTEEDGKRVESPRHADADRQSQIGDVEDEPAAASPSPKRNAVKARKKRDMDTGDASGVVSRRNHERRVNRPRDRSIVLPNWGSGN